MVNVNDMFYGYSADENIKEKGEYGGVVTSIMKYLLEEKIVDGIVAVKEGFDMYDAVPTIITDPKDVIVTAGSLHCGTLNIAKFLSKYLNGARDMKIAVTCKPCDAKTIRELMKKNRVIEDNVIMIGLNCGGTMSPVPTRHMIEEVYELDPNDVIEEEISKGKLIIKTSKGEEKAISIEELEDVGWGRRTNCQRCDIKIPRNADLALGNWGVLGDLAGKATFVEVCSQKGADVLSKAIDAGAVKVTEPVEKGIKIREKISNALVKNAVDMDAEDSKIANGDIIESWKAFEDEFSRCMKCYGCREACPLCFCEDCCLEAEGPEWIAGGVTPAAPLFHLTRMVHMVDSCINCGQCTEVCPCEIPVAQLFNLVNRKISSVYGYESGNIDYNYMPFSAFPEKNNR